MVCNKSQRYEQPEEVAIVPAQCDSQHALSITWQSYELSAQL